MRYTHKSGITISGNHPFVEDFVKDCEECDRKEEEFIEELRRLGIKALHPDDGWNDREDRCMYFCYPKFFDGLEIGDVFALGNHEKFSQYRVEGTRRNRLNPNMIYYYYKRIKETNIYAK